MFSIFERFDLLNNRWVVLSIVSPQSDNFVSNLKCWCTFFSLLFCSCRPPLGIICSLLFCSCRPPLGIICSLLFFSCRPPLGIICSLLFRSCRPPLGIICSLLFCGCRPPLGIICILLFCGCRPPLGIICSLLFCSCRPPLGIICSLFLWRSRLFWFIPFGPMSRPPDKSCTSFVSWLVVRINLIVVHVIRRSLTFSYSFAFSVL